MTWKSTACDILTQNPLVWFGSTVLEYRETSFTKDRNVQYVPKVFLPGTVMDGLAADKK